MKMTIRRGFGRASSMLLLAAVLAHLSPAHGDKSFFQPEERFVEYDPTLVEQWKEVEVALPAYPQDANLIPVALAPTDRLKLYVDSSSVSRAADRVLRMTLVVESPAGARSVFYDGFRCEERQYKTYAVGAAEGKFVAVRNAQWRKIPHVAYNGFREFMRAHYACDESSSARTPHDFLYRLQH
jgi:hypothetical protein